MIFDLEHWRLIGEQTDRFIVQWADSSGILGPDIYVEGNSGNVKRSISYAVQMDTPGFRIEAMSRDSFFIDQLRVESEGFLLKDFMYEEERNDGFCLSTDPGDQYHGRCIGDISYKCIDFCSDGSWRPALTCANKIECNGINVPVGAVSITVLNCILSVLKQND